MEAERQKKIKSTSLDTYTGCYFSFVLQSNRIKEGKFCLKMHFQRGKGPTKQIPAQGVGSLIQKIYLIFIKLSFSSYSFALYKAF